MRLRKKGTAPCSASLCNQCRGQAPCCRIGCPHIIQATFRRRRQGSQHTLVDARDVEKAQPSFQKGSHRHFVGCVENGGGRSPCTQHIIGQLQATEKGKIRGIE